MDERRATTAGRSRNCDFISPNESIHGWEHRSSCGRQLFDDGATLLLSSSLSNLRTCQRLVIQIIPHSLQELVAANDALWGPRPTMCCAPDCEESNDLKFCSRCRTVRYCSRVLFLSYTMHQAPDLYHSRNIRPQTGIHIDPSAKPLPLLEFSRARIGQPSIRADSASELVFLRPVSLYSFFLTSFTMFNLSSYPAVLGLFRLSRPYIPPSRIQELPLYTKSTASVRLGDFVSLISINQVYFTLAQVGLPGSGLRYKQEDVDHIYSSNGMPVP